jgi:succinate dehydrogenase/fumarate reductase flavoprotein subunit
MKWHEETEVLIIGFGGSGAVAALTAHDAGARVLIAEKMESGGGNTNISLGGFLSLKDFDRGLQYLQSLCHRVSQVVNPAMIRTYAGECMRNRQWLENQGARTHVYGGAAFPQLAGAEVIEKCMVTGPNSEQENSFWNFLHSQVKGRKIQVWKNSPAKELCTNSQGGVIGALIEKEGQEKAVKAKKAVILTCGGFEFDEWMKINYLKGYPYYSFGSPGNSGDGIRMAQRVGADLWHMSGVSSPLGFKAPEFEAAFMVRPPWNRYIFVDQEGRRFTSEFAETHTYHFLVDWFDPDALRFPRIPCYMIFDEATRRQGPMGSTVTGYNRGRYAWSKDNGEEIQRGWILADDTIAGLGRKAGLDGEVLQRTIIQYNQDCELGQDRAFHRPKDKLVAVGPGPYLAMKLWPCLLNTQGGPRRNEKAQVLYPDGRPVPRLYSAGELGSLYGLLYQGAGNLGECLAFGRIAGKEAAQEKVGD